MQLVKRVKTTTLLSTLLVIIVSACSHDIVNVKRPCAQRETNLELLDSRNLNLKCINDSIIVQ